MSLLRVVLQRVAMGVVAAWAVLTTVFLLFAGTSNWHLDTILAFEGLGGTDPEEIEAIRQEYLAERGMDRPLYEQYLDWMTNMFTLQWGESFQTGEAVFPMVTSATVRTATYLLPGLALAVVVGLSVGVYAALNAGGFGDRSLRGVVYLLFGAPNFWLGAVVMSYSTQAVLRFRWRTEAILPTELPFFFEYVLPVLLVATTLSAAIVSYTRSYAMGYAASDLTKLVRAKGGGRVTVARHVVRNAAIPLVSLVFVETLALLALSVFVVEALFGIQGLGATFYNAVWTSDLPVVMGVTMTIAAIGVAGNVAQDLAYSSLDPRVDTGTR